MAAAVLPTIMERFSHKYPGVSLRMEVIGAVGTAPELPSLHQRLIDFALFRLGSSAAAGLTQKVIFLRGRQLAALYARCQ